MSERSAIEWTDTTWNPVRGCVKISPGCKHCYAETFAERWRGIAGHAYEHGFDPALVPGMLLDPLRWSRAQLVFVNSMSDLFQEAVPNEYIRLVVDVMLTANWHTYQVLTKRADRMSKMLMGPLRDAADATHIWWGVSVEDRKYGLPRVDVLRRTSARMRFLSIEPLLEDLVGLELDRVEWVIVGGESGAGARSMDAAWVRRIRDACVGADVPFFFKQWGGVLKKRTGRQLDGRTHDTMPAHSRFALPPLSKRRELSEQLRARAESSYPGLSRAPIVLKAPPTARQRTPAVV